MERLPLPALNVPGCFLVQRVIRFMLNTTGGEGGGEGTGRVIEKPASTQEVAVRASQGSSLVFIFACSLLWVFRIIKEFIRAKMEVYFEKMNVN